MTDVQALATDILHRASSVERLVVAIAGPPAAGKSTLAAQLADSLAARSRVAVVAQDGFHYDNAILDARGQRAVKGAPQTFDVSGFAQLLSRLKAQSTTLAVPVFDRALDLSRNCAALVEPDDRIVLVEGNYLLVDRDPWRELAAYFDYSILLQVPLDTLRQRLVQRWLDHDHTPEQAADRAAANDLPNAEYVVAHSANADLILAD